MGTCIGCPCHENGGNPTSDRSGDLSNWMSALSDDISTTNLALPGTHESMCLYGGCILQCQKWSLTRQYEAGIRFVDIRCRHIDNELLIYHSSVYQNANFDNVLDDTFTFLDAHSQEAVFMRVRAEYLPEHNTKLFPEAVQMLVDRYPSEKFWSGQEFPNMGDVRGKVVVLRDYLGPATFGLPYTYLDIEDMYDVGTLLPKDIDRKWGSVRRHLEKALQGPRTTMYLTYCSGTGVLAWPFTVAHKINKRLGVFLDTPSGKRRLGIIAMDFPRSKLIGKITDSNFEVV
ncbi:1-phosphatidylinositol phosphodiesterase-like [Patiria miniata]|uniref:Phosphatidylinositol-specific phospholipase C X domain-containing protein n=1 Tax=Patiria miniata TaxID=46514 RepID=A0A914B6Z8_PATMI|nr:1-phosphatidylinositol phosphodiesterase-like [Patiria miniata]